MKAISPVFPLVALLLAGCNDSTSPGGSNPADAPADYLKNTAKSQQHAVKTIDLVAVNKAIESFYVQEGRFPKTLEELQEKDVMRVLPVPPPGVKIVYDSTNGVVRLEKQ
jgi:hypothetical protein